MRFAAATMLAASLLGAPRAWAQARTEDGVAAFLSGDYQRAADILKPLAEPPAAGDPAAQLFLAAMYENGLGVPPDPQRACALYAFGGLSSDTLFARLLLTLFQSRQAAWTRSQLEERLLLANLGFDHGFEPAVFSLESGDWVRLDLGVNGVRATVSSGVAQTEQDVEVLTSFGAVFLPIQHSRLLAGPARSTARHFIEFFTWMPAERVGTLLDRPRGGSGRARKSCRRGASDRRRRTAAYGRRP